MLDMIPQAPIAALPQYKLTAEHIAAYQRDGYVVLRGFFDPEEVEPLRLACLADPTVAGGLRGVMDSTGNTQRVAGWTELGNDLLGVFPRIARAVDGAEALLGAEVYHWHSKLSMKPPHTSGRWDWHQDYPYWYNEGCLYPEMLTLMIGVDPCFEQNGCVKLVRGSQKLGRVDHGQVGETIAIDPERLEQILQRHEIVPIELQPGDACYFDGNTLHASGPNDADVPRTIMHISYNTVRNDPYVKDGQEHHQYKPLHKVADTVLADGDYEGVLKAQTFNKYKKRADGRNSYGYKIVEV